jgi:hypothetical protein
MVNKKQFKETALGYVVTRKIITFKIELEDGDWYIIITVLGIELIKVAIHDILELLKRKRI